MTAPRVGERFGRYRLDRQVGMGGMGVVYAATDTRLSRTVAVKVISARHAAGEGFRRRFEREADTLARLDSPHVITIYDAGEVDGHPYIATQFVGGDLGHALAARGALPVPAAVEITRQLAEALHDAHQAGVVHRDIKPSNVLLRDTDATRLHAYLCDFGIAQDEGGESLNHRRRGGGDVGLPGAGAAGRRPGRPGHRHLLPRLPAVGLPDRRPALQRQRLLRRPVPPARADTPAHHHRNHTSTTASCG